jgi:pimeloyl-ACP methyl ester carboxylesterase
MSMPWRRRRLFATAGVLLVLGVALIWSFGSIALRGGSTYVAAAKPPARDLRLLPTGGVVLAATYWPGKHENGPGVLVLHGIGASRDAEASTARWLASRGYAVLTIDFRGHGESTQTARSLGWNEAADAHDALRWLKSQLHGGKVAIIGVSMGGAAALLGPDGPARADAFILQCVYPDIRLAIANRAKTVAGPVGTILEPLLSWQALPRFGISPDKLSPVSALAAVHSPVLIIGGGADRYTPPSEFRALFDAAPRGRRMLWIAPGADHAATSVLATPAYYVLLDSFLRRTIG